MMRIIGLGGAVGITIYDIARQANVSIATVSRVFNHRPRVSEQTRARVFEVARELGYQPHASAQNLARRQTGLVSAVIPMLTNPFFIEVMRGIQDRLAESDYDLLVYSARTMKDVDGQLESALNRGRAAGVLLFSAPLTPPRLRRLKRSGQPVVLIDQYHPDFDSVSTNNEVGGYQATRRLIELGYRRIGLVMAHGGTPPAIERRSGYERALREAGLPVDPAHIAAATDPHLDGYSEEAGYQAMRILLGRNLALDAVFAICDMQALGARQALEEAGRRVPDDVGLIGFDDIMISKYVGLSTLRQPMYEMGKIGTEKLLRRIALPDLPTSSTVFTPSLVERTTTQPCKTPAPDPMNADV